MPLSSIQVCFPLGKFTSTLIKKTLPADNTEISLVFFTYVIAILFAVWFLRCCVLIRDKPVTLLRGN